MAASTIPNSGGPGSSVELSAVTIAVRDKVIDKFTGQPLEQMNESVKALLSIEADEQKRLGILAARIYILRQRILKIAEPDPDRVVTASSPKASDMNMSNLDNAEDTAGGNGEWTRLRILEDCEVNGVRFPKTVIIDVNTADAERLIANGNAQPVNEPEVPDAAPDAAASTDATPADPIAADAPMDPFDDEEEDVIAKLAAMPEEELQDAPSAINTDAPLEAAAATDQPAEDEEPAVSAEELSALSEALGAAQAMDPPEDETATAEAEAEPAGDAVVEAPSAAEVTAALEALSAPADEMAKAEGAADVAAELAALSEVMSPRSDDAGDDAPPKGDDDAADVAAALEAAATAMKAGPSDPDTTNLPAAGDENDEDGDKPTGWFEAQQNAEKAMRAGLQDDEDAEDNDKA